LKVNMKLIKKLLTGAALAVSAMSAQAAILLPATGDSEFVVFVLNPSNGVSLAFDTGFRISTFDTAVSNSSFANLSTSPYWTQFISGLAGTTASFGVVAADSIGPASALDSRRVYLTALAGTSPSNTDNGTLSNRAGNVQSSLNALNGAQTTTFLTAQNASADGSSLSLAPGAISSWSTLNNGVIGPTAFNAPMVNVGNKAELFKIGTSAGAGITTGSPANLTDFYSDTETDTNTGAFFELNIGTGALSYTGAPTTVVNPVPEASEWAMMLSGLGMLGLMVRRRRNNI
jgi:hypothetical protein